MFKRADQPFSNSSSRRTSRSKTPAFRPLLSGRSRYEPIPTCAAGASQRSNEARFDRRHERRQMKFTAGVRRACEARAVVAEADRCGKAARCTRTPVDRPFSAPSFTRFSSKSRRRSVSIPCRIVKCRLSRVAFSVSAWSAVAMSSFTSVHGEGDRNTVSEVWRHHRNLHAYLLPSVLALSSFSHGSQLSSRCVSRCRCSSPRQARDASRLSMKSKIRRTPEVETAQLGG